jgi:4,5-dihydroxyphthalate decarboxylase
MTTSTATLTLDTALNENNPSCQPLRSGAVTIPGVELRQLKFPNIINPFRRMARRLEFDLSEQAVVCYFVARRYGLPMTAVPVFPASRVDYGQGISINTRVARTAKDLEGKKVGMRAYTVTASTRQMAYIADQGADLSKITWVSNDVEHVQQFHVDAPKNVEYQVGADLRRMLIEGELAAAFIDVPDQPDIKPLNPNARQDGIERFKRDHIYHLIHLITVNDRVLEREPGLLRAVYDGFKRSKQAWLAERGGVPPEPWEDPMPIGLSETRATLEDLMRLVVAHGILPRPLDIDELFPGNFEH